MNPMRDSDITGETGVGDLDTLLEALCHPYRRLLLYNVMDEGVVSLDEAPRVIADELSERSAQQFQSLNTDAIHIELHHNHLPKLMECNLVDVDDATDEIRYLSPPEELTEVLQTIRRLEN